MNLKRLTTVGLTTIVLLAGSNTILTAWYANRIAVLDDAQSNTRIIARDVAELLALGQDAVLHNSPRVARQWRAVHASLLLAMRGLLQHDGPTGISAGSVAGIMSVVEALPGQFEAIAEESVAMDSSSANIRRETLIDHMSIETRRVSDGVFDLSEMLAERRTDLLSEQLWVQSLLSALFLLVAIAASFSIYSRILVPIQRLKSTALKVKSGDLSARNALESDDELGLLSHSFDAMTDAIQSRQLVLLQSQRETAALYDTLNQHSIVSLADRHGHIIHANDAFCRVSGYSRTELLGHDHRIVNSGMQSDAFWHEFWSTINSGALWRGEICNRAKDGSLYWVDSMVAPLLDVNGAIDKFISIRSDITDRKRSEANLRESEAMFASSFQSAASGMATLSIQGRWLEVNSALCRFLGYTDEELKRLTFDSVTHPDETARDNTEVSKLVAGEMDVYHRAKRYIHKDGSVLWGLVNISVVRDAQDAPHFLIAQIVDITARKRAEEALQISTALLEESQQIAKVGGWELNLETGSLFWTAETYRIHEASPDTFNPTVDAGVGYFLPDSRKRIEDAIQSALHQRVPYDLELETLTTQGHRIDIRTTGKPWVVDDKVVRLSGIFQDITERKRYEQELEKARSYAEESARSKGQFLANMSHEIRTPMNAILGLLQILQSTELTARQRDYATKTQGAAQSLLGLLNDILDFSKIEADKMTLEREPFRLDRLMRNLAVILSANVGSKNVEVLFDVDTELPEVVVGDAMRLQQVLVNLGGNAVKFTNQGQVVLSLRKLSATPRSVTIAFALQDSGIGIAPEHQAHIFSGFSQAEGSTTRRFGGTGLGLAISKRFVELMGGSIQVQSTQGVGSIFTFVLELPVVQAVPPELALPSRPVVAARPVLVVDDSPIAGALTQRMIQSWGWSVDLVSNGAMALELLSSRQAAAPANTFAYPVIYMDWQLPGMDGWETTKRIRQFARQHDLPQPTIIMLTAHGRETLAQRSVSEQDMLNGFLAKPVTASMLLDALLDASNEISNVRKLANGRSSDRQLAGMRILVVEDNLINQQVAEELLCAEGAIVSLAANGKLGVDAVAAAASQFDVVLMDIQMPVMDGYSATRVIRQEMGLGQLPIIAMTANAMASDREACLTAGMSEHIGKPFDMRKLVSLLIRTTRFKTSQGDEENCSPAHREEVSSPTSSSANAGLDLDAALARMAGMKALYIRAAQEFSNMLTTMTDELRAYLVAGNRKSLVMCLHTLKGNAGTVGATALADQAFALESLCKTDTTAQFNDECATGLDVLDTVIQTTQLQLGQAIKRLLPEVSAPRSGTLKPATALNASSRTIAALQELGVLARASNLGVLMRFADLKGDLVHLPNDFCEDLARVFQDLDLEAAAELCSQMEEKLTAAPI